MGEEDNFEFVKKKIKGYWWMCWILENFSVKGKYIMSDVVCMIMLCKVKLNVL